MFYCHISSISALFCALCYSQRTNVRFSVLIDVGPIWRRKDTFILKPFSSPPSSWLPSLDRGRLLLSLHPFLSPGYGAAWEVCSLLGQSEGYGDLEARQELLAFSLTHCPPDNIQGLLAASSDLQTQVTSVHILMKQKGWSWFILCY